MTRVVCVLVLIIGLSASLVMANTSGGGSMSEVKTEVNDFMDIVWMVVGAAIVLYGLYEIIKFASTSAFTGGSMLGIASFILGATMMVYVVPKFSTKAQAYGATIEHVTQESRDAIDLGE